MFIYKGKRNYIHSSDVISFINSNYSFSKIDIKFHKILKSQPKIFLTTVLNNRHSASIVAKIEKKNFKKFLLFKETKVKIKNNYSYDENILNKFFKLTDNDVKCKINTEIKYIDLIVSMTKFWHVIKISKKKNWLVARVNLHKKINDKKNKQILIRFNKIMNNSYTESDIIINKSMYGKIYFQGINK